MNFSALGSQRSLRSSWRQMFTKWHKLVALWPVSTSAVGFLRVRHALEEVLQVESVLPPALLRRFRRAVQEFPGIGGEAAANYLDAAQGPVKVS